MRREKGGFAQTAGRHFLFFCRLWETPREFSIARRSWLSSRQIRRPLGPAAAPVSSLSACAGSFTGAPSFWTRMRTSGRPRPRVSRSRRTLPTPPCRPSPRILPPTGASSRLVRTRPHARPADALCADTPTQRPLRTPACAPPLSRDLTGGRPRLAEFDAARCTHLVTDDPCEGSTAAEEVSKLPAGGVWSVRVVSPEWVHTCIRFRPATPRTPHLPSTTRSTESAVNCD